MSDESDVSCFSVSFEVAGTPVAKGRPKIVRWGSHVGLKTPEKTVNYESAIAWAASKAMVDRPPYEGAVEMVVWAYFPIPSSFSKKKRMDAESLKLLPLTKPDIDNIFKAVADACNNIVYKDDKAIVSASAHKYYSNRPRIEVCVIGI